MKPQPFILAEIRMGGKGRGLMCMNVIRRLGGCKRILPFWRLRISFWKTCFTTN